MQQAAVQSLIEWKKILLYSSWPYQGIRSLIIVACWPFDVIETGETIDSDQWDVRQYN